MIWKEICSIPSPLIIFFLPCLFFEKLFLENYFLIFLYLFAIKKIGQRKTLSSQRKI